MERNLRSIRLSFLSPRLSKRPLCAEARPVLDSYAKLHRVVHTALKLHFLQRQRKRVFFALNQEVVVDRSRLEHRLLLIGLQASPGDGYLIAAIQPQIHLINASAQ